MSVERDGNQIELICDGCGEAYHTVYDKTEFTAMMHDARLDGFRIECQFGKWSHICDNCYSNRAHTYGASAEDLLGDDDV